MKKPKLFILLPDGIGLRNFAFTSFVDKGEQYGWDVVFWNNTPFDLSSLNYKSVTLSGKPRPQTDLLKRAKIAIELDHFSSKFEDPVYQDYKFKPSNKGLRNKVKNLLVSVLSKKYSGARGLKKIRENLENSERKGRYYKACKEQLQKEKPDLVFCTNQRPLNAIAPLTAAKDLGIPTATFIYSWDNLPKATLIVSPDIYFVWSDLMKKQLLDYYPHIESDKVLVTGTPQFEAHFNKESILSKDVFFKQNNLDLDREYICFSGDDVTTSPDDPQYLEDLAESLDDLNNKGYDLGIIFRRCPVDFSERYDKVLEKYQHIIVPLAPKWIKVGDQWNKVLPTIEDQSFLSNTVYHSRAVVNLGSSMIFDFAIHNKPCLYINYDVDRKNQAGWSTSKIYKFVHFRSMPTGDEVIYLNSKNEIEEKVLKALNEPENIIKNANQWFSVINKKPAGYASDRIWKEIDTIK